MFVKYVGLPNLPHEQISAMSLAVGDHVMSADGEVYAMGSAGSPITIRRSWRFADAKSTFQYVAELENCNSFCEENIGKELQRRLSRAGLPDIFYAGLFSWRGHSVVGIGRDLEHRKHVKRVLPVLKACRQTSSPCSTTLSLFHGSA